CSHCISFHRMSSTVEIKLERTDFEFTVLPDCMEFAVLRLFQQFDCCTAVRAIQIQMLAAVIEPPCQPACQHERCYLCSMITVIVCQYNMVDIMDTDVILYMCCYTAAGINEYSKSIFLQKIAGSRFIIFRETVPHTYDRNFHGIIPVPFIIYTRMSASTSRIFIIMH